MSSKKTSASAHDDGRDARAKDDVQDNAQLGRDDSHIHHKGHPGQAPEDDALSEPVSIAAALADDTQHHQPQNELEYRIAELTEALQRERADATNLRRRHTEEMAGLKTHVTSAIVRQLLPVIDNVERALKHVPQDLEGHDFVKGVQGVAKQFEKTLADIGVERIATVGQPFDPHYHEAVSMEDGPGVQEVVSEELQAGYRIGEDVVRHAMVRVALQ